MKLRLNRFADNGDTTLGMLFIDDVPACFILEDEFRDVKIKHDTRIPAGTYEITLRKEGSFHSRYSNHKDSRIRQNHNGMLWLRNVPNFEYILIHIGNTDEDTSGCLLTGTTAKFTKSEMSVFSSTEAYLTIYPQIAKELETGNKVFIDILDDDRK